MLGLWEAENAGVRVPPATWERAARWYLSVQSGGGWTYHPDANTPPTVSMTSAGVGSLMICKMQLSPYRKRRERPISPLLTPVVHRVWRHRGRCLHKPADHWCRARDTEMKVPPLGPVQTP